jgi:hypothetical protein
VDSGVGRQSLRVIFGTGKDLPGGVRFLARERIHEEADDIRLSGGQVFCWGFSVVWTHHPLDETEVCKVKVIEVNTSAAQAAEGKTEAGRIRK